MVNLRIECKSRLQLQPRASSKRTQQGQGGGKIEMRVGHIAVGFDAPAQPRDRFRMRAELRFGDTGKHHPSDIDECIAGREAERSRNKYGLPGSPPPTEKILRPIADVTSVRLGQISIQREHPLAFGDTFGRAV